jgi:hypothetical protein
MHRRPIRPTPVVGSRQYPEEPSSGLRHVPRRIAMLTTSFIAVSACPAQQHETCPQSMNPAALRSRRTLHRRRGAKPSRAASMPLTETIRSEVDALRACVRGGASTLRSWSKTDTPVRSRRRVPTISPNRDTATPHTSLAPRRNGRGRRRDQSRSHGAVSPIFL